MALCDGNEQEMVREAAEAIQDGGGEFPAGRRQRRAQQDVAGQAAVIVRLVAGPGGCQNGITAEEKTISIQGSPLIRITSESARLIPMSG